KGSAKADAPASSTGETASATKGMAKSGNDKVRLQVYGQVNRGILATDDGTSTDLYHVDNDNSATRIGMKGTAKINDDLTAGTKIEVQFESNSTAAVNQDDESVGPNNFTERHLDAYFLSKTWGKFSFGQGDTATNGTSEIDLSGTSVIGYSYAGGMAGGINFVNPATGLLSGIDISDVMTNMDGLSRRDRFRYDTPSFGGFSLAGSLVEDSKRDLALRYSGKMPGATIAAAAGYAFQDRSSTKHQANGSFSVLMDSGFNVTFAGGMRDIDIAGRDTPYFVYGKLGYKADLNSYGDTNFAFDYGRYEDIRQDDDTAQLFGIYAVQQIKDAGTELYLGYRWHDLDVPGTEYDAIHAAMLGTRIKF
ncbi:MAG TPA: hypothetical protein DHV36_08930, partial [Desulfobacteraceae bacterium]|nr:hypothetical protein [Desulfobacteraceae bacterium]